MPTIKLYDEDAYRTEFTAQVLSCEKTDKGYCIELDRTCFFPEEGGQSPDKGVLAGADVTDVQIKGDTIYHFTNQPLEAGESVSGSIDWKHRFSNMQQHSGEHIFSGIVNKKYGYNNVGFHLSDQIVTMDYDGPLTREQADEVEYLVNQAIIENIKVEAWYPKAEQLETLEYRSKKALQGSVRIVKIGEYDICACCAPHVARTGEIGGFKIQSLSNYKGGVRISMLCGFRALEAARQKSGVVAELMDILTTGQDQLAEAVRKQKNTIMKLTSDLNASRRQLLINEIEKMDDGRENLILFCQGVDSKTCRKVVSDMTSGHSGYCGIFSGNDENGYNYVIASSSKDCGEIGNILKDDFAAKGGGSPQMIQGTVAGKQDDLQKLFNL